MFWELTSSLLTHKGLFISMRIAQWCYKLYARFQSDLRYSFLNLSKHRFLIKIMTRSFNNNNPVCKDLHTFQAFHKEKKVSPNLQEKFIVSVALGNETLEADCHVSVLAGVWHKRHMAKAKSEESYTVKASFLRRRNFLLNYKCSL